MRRLQVITNSEVDDFDRCAAYWGYRYGELLRPIDEVPTKGYGSLYHLGAAAGWRAAWSEGDLSIESRRDRAIPAAMKAVGDAVARAILEVTAREPEGLDEMVAELEEHREIALWSLPNYFTVQASDLRMVPLVIEGPFDVPVRTKAGLPSWLRHQGVIDLALWDREASLIAIHDHKTSGYGVDTVIKRLPLDTQLSGYLQAVMGLQRTRWQKEGDPFAWAHTTPVAAKIALENVEDLATAGLGALVINFSRRARPASPKVNKLNVAARIRAVNKDLDALMAAQEADGVPRGEVSVAQCDTTADVYGVALLDQVTARAQPITDKQREFLLTLRGKGDQFFHQVEFYRGPAELERWRQEQWVKAAKIREATRDPSRRTRNPHACAGPTSPKCVYADVCMSPDSPEARAKFRVATSPHEEVSEAENGSGRHGETRDAGERSRIGPAAIEF